MAEEEILQKPTCEKPGKKQQSCTACEFLVEEVIPELGHIVEHEHQDLVRQGVNYVSCTCITYCTRPGCAERVSVTSSVWKSVLGIMVQYFCGNCNEPI